MASSKAVEASIDLPTLLQHAVYAELTANGYDDIEENQGGLAAAPEPTTECSGAPPSPPTKPSQSHRNLKRRLTRKKRIESNGHLPTDRTKFEHVQLADEVKARLNVDDLPSTEGGYGAKNLNESASSRTCEYTAEALVRDFGFTLVKWDGREARPLVDEKGRIFAVLAGRPGDSSYDAACKMAYDAVVAEGERAVFQPKEQTHRRGRFPALAFGLSQGNGQPDVRRLNEGAHADTIHALRANKGICRLANYADAAFALWSPKLYSFYREYMSKVESKTGERRNFEGSVFACATVNFGPQVCTYKHRDVLNLAFGWCAITALGKFDHTQGGHIVLWEAKLVIEFPSGSTILIPSATITHSNTPLQLDNETRVSFTQYTGGGIFRWVDNDYKTSKALYTANRAKYDENVEKNKTRWQLGLSLYSTLSDLTSSL